MVAAIFRSIFAVVSGLILAMALIVGIEVLCNLLHPFPEGFDHTDMEACKAHVAKFPPWVLAIGAVCWTATALVSTWLATRLGARRHPLHGILIGILLWAAVVLNISMLPYPIWFEALVVVGLPLATLLGIKLGRGSPPALAKAAV
jgi:hypothetical protein